MTGYDGCGRPHVIVGKDKNAVVNATDVIGAPSFNRAKSFSRPAKLPSTLFICKTRLSMSIWQKYRSLAPRTRVLIGVGIMGYAGLGLLLSDTAEEKFGLVPTEKDKEELDRIIPKIRLVDRDDTLTKGDS